MDLSEQVTLHKELSEQIAVLEEQKRVLGIAIMQNMESATLQLPGFVVRRFNRLSIKLSIDEARFFDAVKLEETVDKEKIKALYKSGHPINGVSEINYIQVSKSSLK
jgi:hypothetical protein